MSRIRGIVGLTRLGSVLLVLLAVALTFPVLMQPQSTALAVENAPPGTPDSPAAVPVPDDIPPLGVPKITVGSTTSDPASKVTTFHEVKLDYLDPGEPHVSIGKITLQQADLSNAATLSAAQVDLQSIVIYFADSREPLLIDKIQLRNLSAPMPAAGVLGLAGHPGDLPPFADFLLAVKADAVTIPTLRVVSNPASVRNGLVLRNIALTKLDTGKIADFQIGSVKFSESFSESGPFLSLQRFDIQALDLSACAAWFDDRIAQSSGPGKHQVYKSLALAGLSFGDEDTFLIERAASSGLTLAPPTMPPSSLWALIGKLGHGPSDELSPTDIATFWRDSLKAFTMESLELSGAKFIAPGRPPLTLDVARIEDFTGTGFGALRLDSLDFSDPSGSGTTVAWAALGLRDVKLVNIERFLLSAAKGKAPPAMALDELPQPRISGIALDGFDAFVPDVGRFTLKSFTLDTPAWTEFLPTGIKSRIDGFTLPTLFIRDPPMRRQILGVGLETVTLSASLDAAWKAVDQTAELGPIVVDLDNLGRAEIRASVGGIPQSLFEEPNSAPDVLQTLDLRHLGLSIVDKGGLANLLDFVAGLRPSTRTEMADIISRKAQLFMIGTLGLDEGAYQVGVALKAFIANPKSVSFDISATPPIPATAVIGVSQGDEAAASLIAKSIKVSASANK